ncbi:MAG: VOC family protein, partial [Mycobacterium sp.]
MLLHPDDQFHVGVVVHDFEAARRRLTDTFGYEWGPDVQMEYTMLLPDGPFTYQQRLQYSVTEPRLELV